MSSTAGGPLANYNSLTDKNLTGYFANTRMRRHLLKSGLITKEGHITTENAYRLKIAKKQHREHVRELLANAIVDKALDMERIRQHEIRKRLDELYKIELVSKVRSERSEKSKEELYALLSPRSSKKKRQIKSAAVTTSEKESTKLPDINFDEKSRKFTYETTSVDSGASSRFFNPKPPGRSVSAKNYGKPPHPPSLKNKKKKKRKVHRGLLLAKSDQMVAHRVQVQSMAEVTMKYLGSSLNLTNDMFPANKLSEIQVIQQHCGASTVCVFRELIPPNTVFTFVSRRHRGSPFGLTINIDGIKNIRISSCCEYKHKPGFRLGGKNSQFGLISVQGAAPCYRCQVRMNLLDNKNKEEEEKDASSDEEAATRSFDIIVSRGGNRRNEIERPVSAHATTQTEVGIEEEKSESLQTVALSEINRTDDYKDDFFEDDDEEEDKGDKINDHLSSSGSESDKSSDSDVDVNESDDEKKDEDKIKPSISLHNESSEKDEVKTDDKIEDQSDESSDVDDCADEGENITQTADQEKEGSIKEKEEKEKEFKENLNEETIRKTYESDSGDESVESDGEDSNQENSSSLSSQSSESEPENDPHDNLSEEDDKHVTEKNKKGEISNESEEHIDIDEYLDSDDDEDKKGTSVASVISRESTMLTGNEDGRCDSENKTIHFNEEVDVVHYEKVDVESAIENTPRSDDDEDEENGFETIKSGGERIVFTKLDDGDDDDDDILEEAKKIVDGVTNDDEKFDDGIRDENQGEGNEEIMVE